MADGAPKKTRCRSEVAALDSPVVVSGKRSRKVRTASPSLCEIELAGGASASGSGNTNASGSNQYVAPTATGPRARAMPKQAAAALRKGYDVSNKHAGSKAMLKPANQARTAKRANALLDKAEREISMLEHQIQQLESMNKGEGGCAGKLHDKQGFVDRILCFLKHVLSNHTCRARRASFGRCTACTRTSTAARWRSCDAGKRNSGSILCRRVLIPSSILRPSWPSSDRCTRHHDIKI